MTDNHYAPPAAAVDDPPSTLIGRPAAIRAAVWLFVGASLVSAAGNIYVVRGVFAVSPFVFGVAIVLGLATGVGLATWITMAVWKGRNRGRVTLAALLCLKVASSYRFWPMLPRLDRLYSATYLVSFALLIVAVGLLYTRDARGWFAGGRVSDYQRRDRLTSTSA